MSYPDFYNVIGVYFNDYENIPRVGIFLIASLVFSFVGYEFGKRIKFKFDLDIIPAFSSQLSLFIIYLAVILQATTFFYYYDSFAWGAGASNVPGIFWLTFRISELILLFLLTSFHRNKIYYFLLCLAFLMVMVVNIKSGNRSDIVYLLFAYLAKRYHGACVRINLRRVIGFALLVMLVLIPLQLILAMRHLGSEDLDFANAIKVALAYIDIYDNIDLEGLMKMLHIQDYFAPGATLPMAINKYNLTWSETVASILGNLVPGFDATTTSNLVVSQYGLTFDRGTGFAYLYLTDGYLLFGMAGSLLIGLTYGAGLGIFVEFLTKQKSPIIRNIWLLVFGFYALQLIRNSIGTHVSLIITGVIPSLLGMLMLRRLHPKNF